MKETDRELRARQIETAALDILETQGHGAFSIIAVARAANASNETIYRWYGDKTGLYEALIRRNTQVVADALQEVQARRPQDILARVAPVLLTMLLSPGAIALNRAAAADHTGTLGAALTQGGRGTVGPWIAAVMKSGLDSGAFSGGTPRELAQMFVTLLVGDLQIRRVTHAMPAPSAAEIDTRASTALKTFHALYPPLDERGPAP